MSHSLIVKVVLLLGVLYLLNHCLFSSPEVTRTQAQQPAPAIGMTQADWREKVNAFRQQVHDQYALQDENLIRCIEESLVIFQGAIINGEHQGRAFNEPADIDFLDCRSHGISQLAGIEHFIHLKRLNLSSNPISYIEPLSALTNLEQLDLSGTQVKSLMDITNLDNLTGLNLNGTHLERLDPLLDFANLEKLNYTVSGNYRCGDLEQFFRRQSDANFYLGRPSHCLDFDGSRIRF